MVELLVEGVIDPLTGDAKAEPRRKCSPHRTISQRFRNRKPTATYRNRRAGSCSWSGQELPALFESSLRWLNVCGRVLRPLWAFYLLDRTPHRLEPTARVCCVCPADRRHRPRAGSAILAPLGHGVLRSVRGCRVELLGYLFSTANHRLDDWCLIAACPEGCFVIEAPIGAEGFDFEVEACDAVDSSLRTEVTATTSGLARSSVNPARYQWHLEVPSRGVVVQSSAGWTYSFPW